MEHFSINDCGILIGLISTPRNINTKEFFELEIEKNLSSEYRTQRAKNQKNQKNEYLYTPTGYKTFGNQNLAIISLIDDYSYANRVFHPAHGSRIDGVDFYNYDYQVLTCIDTFPLQQEKKNNHLKEIFKKENRSLKNPIICITRLKINNFLLLGNGILCIEAIKKSLFALASDFNEIEFVVLDNLGSEELVVITFSRNFTSIAKLIHKIRHLTVNDIISIDTEKSLSILENRVKIDIMENDIDWKNAHLFSSSFSLPGYNIYANETSFEIEQDKFAIIIDFTWEIKPGHANNFKKEFQNLLKKNGLEKHVSISNEPLRIDSSTWVLGLEFSQLKEKSQFEILNIIENLRNFDIDQRHTRKLFMKMRIKDADHVILDSTNEIMIDRHPRSFSYCKKIIFSGDELKNLRSYLEKSKTSKLLREKILKMYNNYNSCIIDPMYFSNFMDLYGFLKSFIIQIKRFAENSKTESSFSFHEWLNQNISGFEQAYYNRFHQSNRTRNMTDYNIEWNGGIQQMISPIDFIYKQTLYHLGMRQFDKFVHVSGFERVHVTQHTFRINMLHITYPELFVSTIWKEIFNFYWRECSAEDSSLSIFKNSNFSCQIKRYVEIHRDFNAANKVHKYLLNSIDDQFINALIADTLSYHYGYNNDYESFSYWYWRILLQSSIYYDKSGNLNSEIFIKFLFRLLFICILGEDKDEQVERLRFKPADAILAELWINYFEDVRSFVVIIKEIMEWSDYSKIFERSSAKLMEKDLALNIPAYIGRKDEAYFSNIYKERYKAFKFRKDMLLNDFENGKISIPTENELGTNIFILALFAAFLQYMKNLDEGNNDERNNKTHVLLRDECGKPIVENYECYYSNVLADSIGGIFCIDKDIQLKCFKARTLFYRAIFDYCMKNKKELINDSKKGA